MSARRKTLTGNALLTASTGMLETKSLNAMRRCGLPPPDAAALYRAVWKVMSTRSTPRDERAFALHSRSNPQAFAVIVGAVAHCRTSGVAGRLRLWARLAALQHRDDHTPAGWVSEKLSAAEERKVADLVKRYQEAQSAGFLG